MTKVKTLVNNRFYRRELNLFGLISIAIFTAIVIVAPRVGEDFGLTKSFQDESLSSRIYWAIEKSHNQIINWNARLGEQFAIIELSLPNWISLSIYSASFVAFILVIANLSRNERKFDWKLNAGYAASLTFLFWPGMEVFFWKTANSSYLQPMILTLLVAIPYSDKQNLDVLGKDRFRYLGYLLICYLAGCSFENVPFALSVSLLILCVWQQRRGIFNYLPILSLIGGWLTLITANSTSIRREFYSSRHPRNDSHSDHYLDRVIDVISTFFSTSLTIFVLSLISVAYLKKIGLLTRYHICLVVASVLVVGSMIAAPYTEARTFLFAWCVMFSTTCYALSTFVERNNLHIFTTPVLLLSLFFGLFTLGIYSSYGTKLNERYSLIVNSLGSEPCKTGIKIKPISTSVPYRYINNRDKWFWHNSERVGKYYYKCKLIRS